MPGILDHLERVLGKDAVAKIQADTKANFIVGKGDEIMRLYEDDDEQAPPARRTSDPDPDESTRRTAEPTDLSTLTKVLGDITAKLKDVPTKADIETTIKTKGDELVTAVSGRVLRQSNELNKIWRRHEREFPNETFDDAAFEAYVDAEVKAGKRFDSITDAYEKMTSEKREGARVESKARERLKELQAETQHQQVPGFTPVSAKSPLANFMKRGRDDAGASGTAVDKAAAALEKSLNARESVA